MLAEILGFRIVEFGYDVPSSRSQSLRLQVSIGLNLLEQNNKEPKNFHELPPAVELVFQ
jgi:hypothetical protein